MSFVFGYWILQSGWWPRSFVPQSACDPRVQEWPHLLPMPTRADHSGADLQCALCHRQKFAGQQNCRQCRLPRGRSCRQSVHPPTCPRRHQHIAVQRLPCLSPDLESEKQKPIAATTKATMKLRSQQNHPAHESSCCWLWRCQRVLLANNFSSETAVGHQP